jgi:IS30 family transposase
LGVASDGAERSRDRRRPGLPLGVVSNHLSRTGGIRPRSRRRLERCLSLEEREEISRGIARGASARAIARALGRSHTTVAREIDRCGGRRRYRAHAADREAWHRSRRPRLTKLELRPARRLLIEERLSEDHSRRMHVSHETIYRALYVQARGTLKRELTRHLRGVGQGAMPARSPQSARVRASSPGRPGTRGTPREAPTPMTR